MVFLSLDILYRIYCRNLTQGYFWTQTLFFSTIQPYFGTGGHRFSSHYLFNQGDCWSSSYQIELLHQIHVFRFQLFSPFTALALAPVESHYSVAKVGEPSTNYYFLDLRYRQLTVRILTARLKVQNFDEISRPVHCLTTALLDQDSMAALLWWIWPGPIKLTSNRFKWMCCLFSSVFLKGWNKKCIYRLRELPGGGFTETVRYIWERHK